MIQRRKGGTAWLLGKAAWEGDCRANAGESR